MNVRRISLLTGLALAALAALAAGAALYFQWPRASGPPLASTEAEQRVLGVIENVRRSGRTYRSVSEDMGRMLRLLTEAVDARIVVEIGTSTGYSGLWFCVALQRTGGRLLTFEIDAERAAMAREHFSQAGVDGLVTVIEGDAHAKVTQLKEPIDVLFLDADKSGYTGYLQKLLPLVRPGGLILADNVSMAPDYMRSVESNPALETVYRGELGITLKKR